MCAKCQANKTNNNLDNYTKKPQTPCKFSKESLEALLKVIIEPNDRSYVQSAINISGGKHCNNYNNKIDAIIRKNL